MKNLRALVREILREMSDSSGKEELLTEPDDVSDRDEENEVSAVGAIAGVTTPLGTGPTYPADRKKDKKTLPKGWQKPKS
jgi:hypothetical protein